MSGKRLRATGHDPLIHETQDAADQCERCRKLVRLPDSKQSVPGQTITSRAQADEAWLRIVAFCRKRVAGPSATILADLETVAKERAVPGQTPDPKGPSA